MLLDQGTSGNVRGIFGCHNWGRPIEAKDELNTSQYTGQPPTTGWGTLPITPSPWLLACPPGNRQAPHWGFTNFISRFFMFVFFCWKHAHHLSVLGNAGVCNQYTQTPSAPPPETLTDLLVVVQTPLCPLGPASGLSAQCSPPTGTAPPGRSLVQTPQPECLR